LLRSSFLPEDGCKALQQADLIIALDWTDLAGTFRIAFKPQLSTPTAKVINVSQDSGLANGWSKDTGAFAATDLHIPCDPDLFMASIADAYTGPPPTNGHSSKSEVWPPQPTPEEIWTTLGHTPFILQSQFTVALYAALEKYPATLIRHNLGFNTSQFRFDHPLSSLGDDGGAGISSGPGMTVGAALALREMAEAGGEARLPYAILGDGDFLMGNSAIWTAACYDIPLLIVIANNASFFNDEVHQERISKIRGRP
jgi:acetolactate synthase-1/2/3 large subunit